ncbi:MBL fold metallo-hydrolase [Foetidibacter luteolus]|uniref:MBL fold metallo-hydrolase n=1 Tax=Foetidibacter luteolus TaxID=2608880 RepID=UPI00129A100A|nr:MBL fold metallo-hydrolase [Foetidibacter luteolus]
MKDFYADTMKEDAACLWWLGQAGYIISSAGIMVVIDPYLSDSAAKDGAGFSRNYPPPVLPAELRADVYIITHDHLDHLDPETISGYQHKNETWFVLPRLAAKKLSTLGVPEERIISVDAGEEHRIGPLNIAGIFALPTGPDVIDTTGYLLQFDNGRTVYHTSDTAYHSLVLQAAPHKPEVMLIPINGKWGNTGPEQAAQVTAHVKPSYVFPNHYDLMPLNSENPQSFKWFCEKLAPESKCVITNPLEPFVWS